MTTGVGWLKPRLAIANEISTSECYAYLSINEQLPRLGSCKQLPTLVAVHSLRLSGNIRCCNLLILHVSAAHHDQNEDSSEHVG